MRYQPLKADLFARHRARFTASLKPNSVAFFNSSDIYPTSADGSFPFKQATDILWLSGVDQEESILLLFPDAPKPEQRQMLFLLETNDLIARWEGAKLSKDEARSLSGIQSIHWLSDFDRILREVMAHAQHAYLLSHEHIRRSNPVETREDRFGADLRRRFPNQEYERSAPALMALRAVKDPEEVAIMQTAADITAAGYDRVLRFLKPGVWEYELEAEFLHEFVRLRSHGFAYTPIIGSGANACVLHYITNDAQVHEGDVVLFDVGAVYGNYACDVTRCFPANGRFSPRQRQVYEAVLRVEKAAINLLKPGVRLPDYHVQVGELMTEELIGLGLITREEVAHQDPSWPAYKKYFMHGTSHYLGLDVHDYGLWDGSEIKEGMVFTVEPGIYIPEEGLGIRIEDDIVVTKGEPINLTKAIPKEVDDIERAMKASS
ncbi:MAG: aminopeptidase P family protein [Flavobacteriaceae bacterium]|nr:aminopeptidase P family protein [Flavobacteriaceae bacterium]